MKNYWPALPMLIIASGPPVLRSGGRGALASVQGEIDAWVLLQVFVYGLAGLLATAQLLQTPVPRLGVSRRNVGFVAGTALLALACLLSSIWSPGFAATAVLSLLFGVGLYVTGQFATSLAARPDRLMDAMLLLRRLSVILGLLVLACYWFHLAPVTQPNPTGLRLRGGYVAVMGLCGAVTVSISMYRIMFGLQRSYLLEGIFVAAGLAALFYSRTRSLFVALAVQLLVIGVCWILEARRRQRSMFPRVVACLVLVVGVGVGLAIEGSWLDRQWSRGSQESVFNLSQRTLIWGYTAEHLVAQPWGWGYSTGFRKMFLSMNYLTQLQYQEQGLEIEQIGEAHNAHLEMLVGTGPLGFGLYLFALATVVGRLLWTMRFSVSSTPRQVAQLCWALLLGMLIDGMTTSAYSLPLHQPFGYLLYVVAVALAAEAAARAERRTLADPVFGARSMRASPAQP